MSTPDVDKLIVAKIAEMDRDMLAEFGGVPTVDQHVQFLTAHVAGLLVVQDLASNRIEERIEQLERMRGHVPVSAGRSSPARERQRPGIYSTAALILWDALHDNEHAGERVGQIETALKITTVKECKAILEIVQRYVDAPVYRDGAPAKHLQILAAIKTRLAELS